MTFFFEDAVYRIITLYREWHVMQGVVWKNKEEKREEGKREAKKWEYVKRASFLAAIIYSDTTILGLILRTCMQECRSSTVVLKGHKHYYSYVYFLPCMYYATPAFVFWHKFCVNSAMTLVFMIVLATFLSYNHNFIQVVGIWVLYTSVAAI